MVSFAQEGCLYREMSTAIRISSSIHPQTENNTCLQISNERVNSPSKHAMPVFFHDTTVYKYFGVQGFTQRKHGQVLSTAMQQLIAPVIQEANNTTRHQQCYQALVHFLVNKSQPYKYWTMVAGYIIIVNTL